MLAALRRPSRSPAKVFIRPRRNFFQLPSFPFPPTGNAGPSPGDNSDGTHTFHKSTIFPYTPKQLYTVVADVDSYHRFIPFCTASRVLTPPPQDRSIPYNVEAELKVGFMSFEEGYVSRVHCRPYEMVKATASSSTPLFESLVTTWSFQPASTSSTSPRTSLQPTTNNSPGPTLVTFDLTYAFANPLYATISGKFFGQVSELMVQAFEKRCLEVYGRGQS